MQLVATAENETVKTAGGKWGRGLRTITAAVLWLVVAAGSLAAQTARDPQDLRSAAAVLVMIEDRGCPYCAKWRAEVGPGYALSEEGRFAPLARRLRGDPSIAFIPNVVYSPTFVLLVQGREIGRILGYPGQDLFWMQIAELFGRSGFKGAETPLAPPLRTPTGERRS